MTIYSRNTTGPCLHYIAPHRMMIDKDGYRFSSVEELDGWDAIIWYVVEIKRKRHIGREIIDDVDQKVARLPHPKSVSIRTALVYEGELSKAVDGDGYFDALVPVDDLLGR